MKKPVFLLILDGWSTGEKYEGNAYYMAKTPVLDKLLRESPTSYLEASGEAVGLPAGQMGNSEVGHLNIGSGRVIYQDLTKISKDIKEGSLGENEILVSAIKEAKNNGKAVHLMGLVSRGGVHSHLDHLIGLVDICKKQGLEKLFIHAFLDGRDVGPMDGLKDIEYLEAYLKKVQLGKIASIIGRYYAMDRDQRWERSKLAYDLLTLGVGDKVKSSVEGIKNAYDNKLTDEFLQAISIEGVDGRIQDGDSVIFFNFRPDRARQLTRAFTERDFNNFERKVLPETNFITMTEYDRDLKNLQVLYKKEIPINTLGEVISKEGLKQFRGAETEKYAHVTFFFNGGREDAFIGEDRALINSPKVATYDLKPEMSIYELEKEVIDRIESKKYDFLVVNIANPDMVGHTGKIEASIKAMEAVDKVVGRFLEVIDKEDLIALITSDHGNIEEVLEKGTGKPITSHTSNPVPLILYNGGDRSLKARGKLSDIAPSVLDLMDIKKAKEMSGISLIKK